MRENILVSLRNFPMFSNIAEADLRNLAGLMREKTFPAGHTIIEEGIEGDTMYLLLEGSANIMKTTVYGDEYVAASISSSSPCVFGEMALIDSAPRSATVKATSECKTLYIGKEDFHTYCRQNPAVGCEILFVISASLVRTLRKENENLKLVYGALIEEIETE